MTDIPKNCDTREIESRWLDSWEQGNAFSPKEGENLKHYTIAIPPPNVTGVLTMGHVLNNTLQDILIRRARTEGKSALWIPGTDHAGIATQTKVERALREEGLHRRDLGREKFLEKACEWRDTHGGIILQQLKKLGCSCDWSRNVHTLDDDYSEAVLKAFVLLYDRGYIYRGQRMVNWCPVSLTALSDEEVIMKPQEGKLYKMRYERVEAPGEFIEISTTRPETLMGDVAVAVHPNDERYAHLIGQHVWRPFPRKQIPIIGDEVVEKDFGTGALKVTPAHDALDFEIGQRHGLPALEVIGPDGHLTKAAGDEFAGMERFAARKAAAKKLDDLGLLVEEENYSNNVGFSERADVPIEPRLSEQWFLRYPKVTEARRAVKEGLIKFYPENWEKTYLHWLDNIKDWCISRQLWWGHRIPVWYRKGADRSLKENWHVSLEGPDDPENWEQDEDVLDTWASSWLWPFATLGWPDEEAMKSRGYESFYPTDTLVTGPDIIFFWVARMIMAGFEFTGPELPELDEQSMRARLPFKQVYFTGIIRDAKGRKMSKSLGNSPDPLELIDQYGADGLRFGMISMAPQGQDIRFDEERIALGRNFCTKLWNASRYRQMQGGTATQAGGDFAQILNRIEVAHCGVNEQFILTRLYETTLNLENCFEKFAFNLAAQEIYAFFWGDFCDWYVEVSKLDSQNESQKASRLAVQDFVLRQLLLLIHPFVPFISEELWHLLSFDGGKPFLQDHALLTAKELKTLLDEAGLKPNPEVSKSVSNLRDSITLIRALKSEYRLEARRDVRLVLIGDSGTDSLAGESSPILKRLAGVGEIITQDSFKGPAAVTPLGTFHLDLAGSAVDVEAEKARIQKDIAKLDQVIGGAQGRLNNKKFMDNAPPEVVEGAKKQLQENIEKRSELHKLLENF